MWCLHPNIIFFAMPPFLSDIKKGELICLMKNGSSVTGAAEALGVSRQTASKWWMRYREGGEDGLASRRANSGRRRKTTAEQDQDIIKVSCNGWAACCFN